jgi:tRNA(His) 5'-end guanylyltransferase
MREWVDVVLGYGESDEFSFVIKKSSELYSRRSRCGARVCCVSAQRVCRACVCLPQTLTWRGRRA